VVLWTKTKQETLRFLDPSASKLEEQIVVGPGENVTRATFSGDGHYLATTLGDHTARVWDVRTGQALGPPFQHERVGPVALSPDGKWLATGGFDKTVCIWEVAAGRRHSVLWHNEPIDALAFSSDGHFLASGAGGDGRPEHPRTLRIWEWGTGEIKLNFKKTGKSTISRLAYRPDNRYLAVGGSDGYVELVDSATGEQKIDVQAHPGGVCDLAFTPDGTTLASGGGNTIRLWDVVTGKELIAIPFQRTCHFLRFTPDGLALISAEMLTGDTTVGITLSADCAGIPMAAPK
jgi:WD40 repeat protein